MRLGVNEVLCSGCRACEIACTAHHDGRFGASTSRIRVVKHEAAGIQRTLLCQMCTDAACVAACPTAALSQSSWAGPVVLDAASCIICSACFDACAHQAAWPHPVTQLPLICDFCGGDPACVKRCVTGALVLSDRSCEARDA